MSSQVRPRSALRNKPMRTARNTVPGSERYGSDYRPVGFETLEQLLAEPDVQAAVDEVVRLVDPDLIARLLEIAVLQFVDDGRRPAADLGIQRLRGPTAPGERSTADGINQTRKAERLSPAGQPRRTVRDP